MKKLASLLMILVLLTGCAAAMAEYPMTLVDQAGREVTLEAEPQTLVSGYYISTSLIMALDRADRLVGIEAKAGSRPVYRLSAPALLELPSVGTAKQFDLEGCAALSPDLVILPLKLKDAAETLTTLGIPVLLVNPEDQALLSEMTALLAQALNVEEQAKALQACTGSLSDTLRETLADCERPCVYLAGNSALLSTAGASMYQSSLIDLAGGVNAAGSVSDKYWAQIDYEQLLAWDPDYIILASDAAYTCEDVLADAALADCKAVREGRVYQMPGHIEAWDSPVPGSVLGAVWLASVLHPDLIDQDAYLSAIEEFYGTFYHFSPAGAQN